MSQYELNLRDYLRIFRKRKVIIFLVFLAVSIGSIIYANLQEPLYKSSATVKIEQRRTISGLFAEWVFYKFSSPMDSQAKIVVSYPILKKTGMRMGLLNKDSSLQEINNVVNRLQSEIDTEKVGQTNMIKINATSTDPKYAADLVTTVIDVYIEEDILEKTKQFTQARQFIEGQLVSLEERIKNSEELLRKTGDGSLAMRLYDKTRDRLVSLELELIGLSQVYTDRYPRIAQIKEEIKIIESQLKSYSTRNIGQSGLVREIDIDYKLYLMLKEKLEEMRIAEAQKIGDISIVSPAAVPDSPVSENKKIIILVGVLMGLILGFSSALIIETMDTSISTIEDVENMVKLPVVGTIPSIQSDHKEESILAKIIGIFMPVSRNEDEEKFISLIAHYKPRSPAAEAYRSIQTNLKLNSLKKTVLVTSAGPREGKSTVVSNLGVVMAQSGLKTLLVSFDLRRPVLARYFGVGRCPGIHELITGTASLEGIFKNITDMMMGEFNLDDIRRTPGIENISIIPSGILPANPAELLKAEESVKLIEKLKSQFDVIIFDSPPVLPVTDASLIAPYMDCVVIVYEIGRTSREALTRTKVQLEAVGANIAGVVLNHTQSQTEAVLNYPYYSYKYHYYDREEENGNGKKKAAQRHRLSALNRWGIFSARHKEG